MKKMLFVTAGDLYDKFSGISRKIFAQYNFFRKHYDATIVGYYGKDLKLSSNGEEKVIKSKHMHPQFALIDFVKKYVDENEPEFIYIRRIHCYNLTISMLRNIKSKGNTKIIWEIPTYPYDFESDNLYDKAWIWIDKIWRKKLHKYVDRIVVTGDDKEIFGIQTINVKNGIIVDDIKPRKIPCHGDEIHLIAAAVLNRWHGYDRLIAGLGEYYKTCPNRKVVFHLVGDGPSLNGYKELVSKLKLGDNVIFYGYKDKEELDLIYDKCDIALESLGLHRSNLTMASTIKSKEYIAKGFPIIASTPLDIFPNGWDYAYYAPTDESPIDINAIIEFYDGLLRNMTKEELAAKIRETAYLTCDIEKNMMQPILEYIQE